MPSRFASPPVMVVMSVFTGAPCWTGAANSLRCNDPISGCCKTSERPSRFISTPVTVVVARSICGCCRTFGRLSRFISTAVTVVSHKVNLRLQDVWTGCHDCICTPVTVVVTRSICRHDSYQLPCHCRRAQVLWSSILRRSRKTSEVQEQTADVVGRLDCRCDSCSQEHHVSVSRRKTLRRKTKRLL